MSENRDRAVLALVSPRAWESWLTKHHATSSGVWLKIVKKNSKMKGPSYEEALDAALCFGWIDGQKDSFDGDYWLQRFTPRKPRSKWSRINVEKAVRLTKQGRMKSAGLTQIKMAKADGRWDAAYEPQGSSVLRIARRPQSVCDPLSHSRCEEARDASATHRDVRRDVERRKEDSRVTAW